VHEIECFLKILETEINQIKKYDDQIEIHTII